MKRRLFALRFAAVLLPTLGAVAASCGGGGEPTLEEYFQQVEEAYGKFEAVGLESGDKEYDSVEDFMNNSFIPTYRDFVDALENIDPPAEVELAHEELVAAQAEVLQLFEDSTDRYAALRSLVDLGELLDEPDFQAVNNRAIEACTNLLKIAGINGIPVKIDC